MPQRDGGAGGPGDFQPHPANHVLAHVEDGVTTRRLQNLDRLHLLDASDRRAGRRDQIVGLAIGDRRGGPVRRVESGRAPARLLAPGVVHLTEVDFGRDDRSRGRLPAGVAHDGLGPAAPVRHLELKQQPQRLAVQVPIVVPRQRAAIPAAPKRRANGVRPLLQERRHVIRLILQPLVVAGPARREQLIADTVSVDEQLVQAMPRDVRTRTHDIAREREVSAEER